MNSKEAMKFLGHSTETMTKDNYLSKDIQSDPLNTLF